MIKAMKQALEALEKGTGWMEYQKATKSLRWAIEEAEKVEPYGYFKWNTGKWKFYHEVEGCNPKTDNRYLALYTTPPQRQPLTDEEIMAMVQDKCVDMRWPSTVLDIARAIEAAHGIKGEA